VILVFTPKTVKAKDIHTELESVYGPENGSGSSAGVVLLPESVTQSTISRADANVNVNAMGSGLSAYDLLAHDAHCEDSGPLSCFCTYWKSKLTSNESAVTAIVRDADMGVHSSSGASKVSAFADA
jgi:hypothetical protein